MFVPSVNHCVFSPVSAAVILMIYPVMTPFWFSYAGGVHSRRMLVELMTIASMSSGGLTGSSVQRKLLQSEQCKRKIWRGF